MSSVTTSRSFCVKIVDGHAKKFRLLRATAYLVRYHEQFLLQIFTLCKALFTRNVCIYIELYFPLTVARWPMGQ